MAVEGVVELLIDALLQNCRSVGTVNLKPDIGCGSEIESHYDNFAQAQNLGFLQYEERGNKKLLDAGASGGDEVV